MQRKDEKRSRSERGRNIGSLTSVVDDRCRDFAVFKAVSRAHKIQAKNILAIKETPFGRADRSW